MCRKQVDIANRKATRGSAIFFCSENEVLFFRYHDTKGEISIAKGLYHIRHKTARLHLRSSEQVFLDLPLLQFAYSKRFLTSPETRKRSVKYPNLTFNTD